MLQADNLDTYVLSTGRTKGVRDFVNMTCNELDIDIIWQGTGIDEAGIDSNIGATIVKINPDFYRPDEMNLLIGNSKKAQENLGWHANTTPEEICAMMVKENLLKIKQETSS